MMQYVAFTAMAAVTLAGAIAITNVAKDELQRMQQVGMDLLESVSPGTASHMPSPSALLDAYMNKNADETSKPATEASCHWLDAYGHCVADGE
jgi:hypothetical protein